MRQPNRSSTRGRDLPDLPGTLSIRIKEDPLAIAGPGRDLGSARQGSQPPWSSPGRIYKPDLTLAERRGVEGDLAAVGRPRGMERQERLRRQLTQPGAVRISHP